MNGKLSAFVVQSESDTIWPKVFESDIMLKLLSTPAVAVTVINSLDPAKITIAEHSHLFTSRSHIIIITFDSFNATCRYFTELKVAGELIDIAKITSNGKLSKTPARKIFIVCIDHASNAQKAESEIFKALMAANDALNADLSNKTFDLPIFGQDRSKSHIGQPFLPPLPLKNLLTSGPNGQKSRSGNSSNITDEIIDNYYIENLLNDLDDAGL